MQLSFDVRIPDGLLAANALLNEKPHQGVPSWNLALHQGIDERNSTAAIGIRASAQLNRIWPRYTGKERDAETGNDYFGARYYASTMGRFMSPDWSTKIEPVPYSKLGDPQTLNLYAYVRNNPLSAIDPDGHMEWGLPDQVNAGADALFGTWQGGQQPKAKTPAPPPPPAQQHISPPPAVAGTLTINIYLNGTSGPDDGHAWLSFMPDGGTNATYGTYGNNAGAQGVQGVNENSELGLHPDTFRNVHLSAQQAAALSQYIAAQIAEGSRAWSYTAPCSSFASGGWYAATGEYLYPARGGVLSTPTNLGNAIRQANGGHNMGVMTHPVSPPPILQGDTP